MNEEIGEIAVLGIRIKAVGLGWIPWRRPQQEPDWESTLPMLLP